MSWFLVVLGAVFVFSNWMMDLSLNAFRSGTILTNGFWSVSGAQSLMVWHFFWYVSVGVFFVVALAEYLQERKERGGFLG